MPDRNGITTRLYSHNRVTLVLRCETRRSALIRFFVAGFLSFLSLRFASFVSACARGAVDPVHDICVCI